MKSLLAFFLSLTSVSASVTFAGVNVAGFDFGTDTNGTSVLSSALAPLKALNGPDGAGQMAHFAQNDSLNLFRMPVSWQFLINNNASLGTANSTLDATNMGQYDQLVQSCLSTGAHCIIDVHNYARFNGEVIGQGGPSNAQFANLWSQIATKYANQTNVVFGVMNEPHDLDVPMWSQSVQAAVTAIRQAGATNQMILMPGSDFTSAQTFVSNGSAGNLSTVKNPDGSTMGLVFDVHNYLDSDGSGTNKECTSNHIQDSFMPLATYLKQNNRTAILSETGGGNSTSCLTNLCQTLDFINANSDAYLGYAGWSAGGFDSSYVLSETPTMAADGSFVDNQIVSQCIVGTRNANSTASNPGVKRALRMTPGSKVLDLSSK